MEQRDLLTNDLLISNTSQAYLVSSAKWGKFLAIAGFVGCALMLIGGIFMQTVTSPYRTYEYANTTKYVGITYIILSVILIFPCIYLNKFSNKIQEAIRSTSQDSADTAFASLKSMFKFYGIFTIIMLVFLALAFLGAIGTLMR